MDIQENLPLLIIILIILLFTFANEYMIPFSYTFLGRFIAILIIVYYANINIYISLVITLIIGYYYSREDYVNLLNMDEGFLINMTINRGNIPNDMIVYN